MTHETIRHPASSGSVLHTRADVDEEVSHWLLGATESRNRARMEWQELGVTMLQTGRIFSAIRMSARLVQAAAGTSDIDAVDSYLVRGLVGGPAIHDPDRCRYYALVSADLGRPWEVTRDLEPLGLGSYVGVPRPGLTAAEAGPALRTGRCRWSPRERCACPPPSQRWSRSPATSWPPRPRLQMPWSRHFSGGVDDEPH